MDVPGYIATLRAEGRLLVEAAERAAPEAAVPTCPDWRVRDLVRHQGGVHRWAAAYVRDARTTAFDDDRDLGVFCGGWPEDDRLGAWFRDGHAALVDALESAPADLTCWTFMPAATPLTFWARRQAHETTIHRVDAQVAAGAAPAAKKATKATTAATTATRVAPEFAADGLDELLTGFGRRRGVRTPVDRTLLLHATDLDAYWHVRLAAGEPPEARGSIVVDRAPADADVMVRASAFELYLLMWNRLGAEAAELTGDPDALRAWREGFHVRWS